MLHPSAPVPAIGPHYPLIGCIIDIRRHAPGQIPQYLVAYANDQDFPAGAQLTWLWANELEPYDLPSGLLPIGSEILVHYPGQPQEYRQATIMAYRLCPIVGQHCAWARCKDGEYAYLAEFELTIQSQAA